MAHHGLCLFAPGASGTIICSPFTLFLFSSLLPDPARISESRYGRSCAGVPPEDCPSPSPFWLVRAPSSFVF